ncbi:MAG: hypothetical protein JWM99_1026 [Verrucomicrobiales bacterium]|nr:hypothetical protein [Verrucomicrobiales bacterium]
MKPNCPKKPAAYALVIVMFFTAVSLIALSGALKWTSTNVQLTDRNNEYFNSVYAAEAATEKVLSKLGRDYVSSGEGAVYNFLTNYQTMYPTTAEDAYWNRYSFSDATGNSNKTYVTRISTATYTNLMSQYAGLNGLAATYRIVSNAKRLGLVRSVTAGVKQDIQVAAIPLFQFAIFYGIDLEINPGPNMTITGRVHSNHDLYLQPQAILKFLSHVTVVGKIYIGKSPLDPTVRTPGTVTFGGEHDGGASSLTLPIGTNNTALAVHAVLEKPPVGELKTSLMGQQRYYNKADLVIQVSNAGVTATSGAFNDFATSIPASQIASFLTTTTTFYNKREGKTINADEIDVAKLKNWSTTNTTLRAVMPRDVSSIYIIDTRTQTSSTEVGVRLVNGQTLPSGGLTIATPAPVYIKGNYNAPAGALGTSDTSGTKPASIVADAITILSTAWNDSNAGKAISSRNAADTTVNAAFLGGIVPSDGAHYSGGVENFPRFLEEWSGDTFTYNGSMVVMFESQYAVANWGGSDVYGAPSRNWAFDVNFMDATKLPPGTPSILTVIRGSWSIVAPNSVL